MRENKFRGKRLDNGEWVFGSLLKKENGECQIIGECHSPRGLFYTDVDPETVGQFTGLFDKTKKEIYEGDVIRFTTDSEDTLSREVWFSDGYFHLSGEDDDDLLSILYVIEMHGGKIIGNEHDNPELLESKPDDSNKTTKS